MPDKTSKRIAPKKTQKKKSSIKKGKVTVSPFTLIAFCGGVIICCLILLLVTTLMEGNPGNEPQVPSKPVTVQVEKNKKENEKTVSEGKKDSSKTEKKTAEKKESKTSASEPKKTPKTDVKTDIKTETKPVVKTEVKTAPSEKTQEQNEKKVTQKASGIVAETPQRTSGTERPKDSTVPKSGEELKQEPDSKTASVVKPSEEGRPKSENLNFPAAVNHAQLCILLDDGGQNLEDLKKFLGLKIPLTVAVLPKLRDTVSSANAVRASGISELMLHQPMQAVNLNVNPGPGAIKPDMNSAQIKAIVQENLREVGPVAGMNNHEGSLITADASKIETVVSTAHDSGIYFLDSRTNVETKIPYVSREMGYGWYERNGYFLDNEKSREEFLKELRKNLDIANKTGCVIMIAHVWSANYMPDLIREVYPELVAKGYSFTTVGKSRGLKN